MPLKYADPEEVRTVAFHYYQSCIDKWKRTNHSKDQAEMLRARKDYQTKAQYARTHHKDILPDSCASPNQIIDYLNAELTKQREKNKKLRRALSLANEQLRIPCSTCGKLVDKRDLKILHNLRLAEYSRE
jgi:hypothetical protein